MSEPTVGESALLDPLLRWLTERRRIRHDSEVRLEFRWYDRRIDVATHSRSARTSAFELKIRDNGRALRQAATNALSFDRSYVVTATRPREQLILRAAEVGVGIIVIENGLVTIVQEARPTVPNPFLRRRLLETFRKTRGS